MRFPVAIAVLLLADLAGACTRADQEAPAPVAAPIRLTAEDVARARTEEIEVGPRIAGTLVARRRAVVRAEVGGSVTAVGPELGQPVKRGTVLVRIAAPALEAAVRSAQKALASATSAREVARRELARTEVLVEAGAIAPRDLEQARSAARSAEAGVAEARAQLAAARSQRGDAVLRAPMRGVVADRAVNQGDVVTPGALLYEIIDPSTMRVQASVPSEQLGFLAIGKPVTFEIRGYPEQRFEGKIERIGPAADVATRQIPILVTLPNPGNKLVAGLFADGRIAAQRRPALVVPLSAVDTGGDQPSVLRVRDGTVERAAVTLGLRDATRELVEVTSGLAEGDVVVARARTGLRPGAAVEVATED